MNRVDTLISTVDGLQTEIDNLRKENWYLMMIAISVFIMVCLLGIRVTKLARI